MHALNKYRDVPKLVEGAWRRQQRLLQASMARMPPAAALEFLLALQKENGFLEESGDPRLFAIPSEEPCRAVPRFYLQFNPRRAARVGAPRTGQCVFDIGDIRRRQRGLQHYTTITLGECQYNAFTNPYPFAPLHTSVASAEHRSQGWLDSSADERRASITRIVRDFVDLAEHLPGWDIGYNGTGAGSTVDHLHFHAFQLSKSLGPLPIQVVAGANAESSSTIRRFGGGSDYPLIFFRLAGRKDDRLGAALELLFRWSETAPDSTANMLATWEDAQSVIYLVPRSRLFEFAPGCSSTLGLMEVAGLFVLSKDGDLDDILGGRMNYARLWSALRSIAPPQADTLNVSIS